MDTTSGPLEDPPLAGSIPRHWIIYRNLVGTTSVPPSPFPNRSRFVERHYFDEGFVIVAANGLIVSPAGYTNELKVYFTYATLRGARTCRVRQQAVEGIRKPCWYSRFMITPRKHERKGQRQPI